LVLHVRPINLEDNGNITYEGFKNLTNLTCVNINSTDKDITDDQIKHFPNLISTSIRHINDEIIYKPLYISKLV